MDLVSLIGDAKLDLFFMSGTGLGAILLAVIAIVFILRAKRGWDFGKAIAAAFMAWGRK